MSDLPLESEEDDSCYHIEFFCEDLPSDPTLAELSRLRTAVASTLKLEDVGHAEISIAIVRGSQMRVLNRQYLEHDYDTDVLSFCLEPEESLGFLLGQLIISWDYAEAQAAQLTQATQHSVNVLDELALYLVHGTLHLVGYDDSTPELAAEMRELERRTLRPMGLEPVWLSEDEKAALLPAAIQTPGSLRSERPS